MKRTAIILALAACCTACATTTERQRVCLSRMNAEHATHGHSAANWAVYDYCMKNPD